MCVSDAARLICTGRSAWRGLQETSQLQMRYTCACMVALT